MPATPAWPPKSAPRLFVATPIAAGEPVLVDGNQAHYLAKVMRVAPGGSVILCDDVTGEWACTVLEAGKRQVVLDPVKRLREREDVPDLWLCPALLKKDRFHLVLEKASELGVAEIRPVVTRRCVATSLNADRARSIVTEAAEQCARTALPVLAEPVQLTKLLADWPNDRVMYFADELGGEPATDAFLNGIADTSAAPPPFDAACGGAQDKLPLHGRRGPQAALSETQGGPRLRGDAENEATRSHPKAALLIGPEGGFDEAERAAIRAHPQTRPITLGPRILRGETAAIAATALWMGIAGDWHNSLARA